MGTGASGEIGRRAGFRFLCLRTCGFKSHLAHVRSEGQVSGLLEYLPRATSVDEEVLIRTSKEHKRLRRVKRKFIFASEPIEFVDEEV